MKILSQRGTIVFFFFLLQEFPKSGVESFAHNLCDSSLGSLRSEHKVHGLSAFPSAPSVQKLQIHRVKLKKSDLQCRFFFFGLVIY